MPVCVRAPPPAIVCPDCTVLAALELVPVVGKADSGAAPSVQPAAFAFFPQVLPQYGCVFPVRESCHLGFTLQNVHVPCAMVPRVAGVGAIVAGGAPSLAVGGAVVEGGR